MHTETISNPFSVINYNYSWQTVAIQMEEITALFPDRYKLIYTDEQEQKVVLLTNLSFAVFGNEQASVITATKIDSSEEHTLLACEAKNLKGSMSCPEDHNRGQYFIDKLAEDMMIVC